MQFICGYHDADLRDATGLGHGRLIALHGTAPVREQWLPRLIAGDVPGIAITEPIGGSQVHAITTVATTHHDGTWTLTGTKTWISRLNEAAVFIVFFKDPSGRLTAGIIDAADGGPGPAPDPALRTVRLGMGRTAPGRMRASGPATFLADPAMACSCYVSTSPTTVL